MGSLPARLDEIGPLFPSLPKPRWAGHGVGKIKRGPDLCSLLTMHVSPLQRIILPTWRAGSKSQSAGI
jgi:hypothetical protein